ncbi:phage tail tape measure protein [Arsenophonus endosymbiont of Crataerina pallida]|uniref:phage tail tape measure protein n=1 Tax=Arsenophonus endosymbiont of Crataerina pallida TaxID=3066235 RepID=UPI0030CE7A5A
MASSFSIGIVVSAALHGTFRAVMGNSQRALERLSSATSQLQQRQASLTRAVSRYGDIGGDAARRLNGELIRVGHTLSRLERQQARLTRVTATSTALRDNRLKIYGQGLETYGMARAAYGAVQPSVKQFMTFQDNMIDMAITAGFNTKTRDALGKDIRVWSLKYNQTQDDLQAASSSLIGNNIDDLDDLRAYLPSIARAATATKTPAELWAQAAFTTKQSLGIAAKDFAAVQNIMTYGGKAGSFEIADQVKWLPELAPQMASVAQGKEAVAEMVAALQVAKIGAGSSDKAANNFNNFLEKLYAPETRKRFADVHIDIEKSLMQQKAYGISPIEGMMNTLQTYLARKSPQALAQFKSAMALQDDKARDKALLALQQNFGLGELFADMQVMAFVRPMLANMEKYRTIRAESLSTANTDVQAEDYSKRLASPIEKMKQLMIASSDLGISIGEQLTPQVVGFVDTVVPLITQINSWVQANPQLVQSIAGVVGGLLAFKIGLFGVRMVLNLVATPFVSLLKGFQTVRSGWLLMSAAFSQGGSLRRLTGFMGRLSRGALRLGKVLGGGLVRGLMIAGRAVLFIGRALMLTPIGLLITGIAVGAFLIYRYWGPISAWFKARWADIKQAFSGGIGGVAALIINWSPVGLFYKAFAGVMRYFNIELPANFTDFGRNLIEGLVSGIRSKLTAARESITEFGGSIKSWFSETLGINSPSRVFMGFGDNIVEGAAIGIRRTTPKTRSATTDWLAALLQAGAGLALPGLPGWRPAPIPSVPNGAGHGMAGQGVSWCILVPTSRLMAGRKPLVRRYSRR